MGLPALRGQSVRFELADPTSRRTALPRRLQLNWFEGPQLSAGEYWRLAVTLKRPHGLLNPHGPDWEALFSRGGSAPWAPSRLGSYWHPPRTTGATRCANACWQSMPRGAKVPWRRWSWGWLGACTLGMAGVAGHRYGALDGDFRPAHRLGGRAGLWLGGVAGAPRPVAPASAMVALGVRAESGFSVGVRRARRVRCAGAASLPDAGDGPALASALQSSGALLPLLAALCGVLLIEPLASLLPGFWLSFAAVAVLVFCFAGRLGGWRPWQAWSRAQWVVAVGLLPALLALGLPISLTAPLANLLAVPWISFAVLPLALLGSALLPLSQPGELLLWWAGGLLEILFQQLALLGQWRPAWEPQALTPWAGLLIGLGAALLLLPRVCRCVDWGRDADGSVGSTGASAAGAG